MASGELVAQETNNEGQGSPEGSLSYSVVARRQRSKELAQKRRTTYKTIMDDLTQTLPFPKNVVSQLDYNSRLRLALCFFRLKSLLMDSNQQQRTNGNTKTEEDKAEKKLTDLEMANKEMPGLLSEFINEALDGFLMVAMTDGTITYLSESIHKHLGLFQSEHIGISLFDLVLEEDHEIIKSTIHKAEVTALARLSLNAAAEVGFFCRMKCSRFKVTNTISKTPGYKLVYISGSLKIAGNETFLVVVVRPVSPPSILELKVEGNMFVTHYTMQMKCTFFDGRLQQLLGYNKTDLLGDVVFTLHHHDDMEATMECSRGVMSRGEGLSGYFRFLTKYGYYVWLQTRASVMYDSRSGKPSYIVCMNFVIDKEKGETALKKRALQITTKEVDEPVITEIDSRSHDPFPLVSREDGMVVNPLDDTEKQDLVNPDSIHSKVTSSSVNVPSPDSNVDSTVSSNATPEESTLPDSTSFEPDSNVPALQIVRTSTGSSIRSSDTGYISHSVSSVGVNMFSPSNEVSSMSCSPISDQPSRKSSMENPSSVFSSPPGSVGTDHSSGAPSVSTVFGSNGHLSTSQSPQLASLLSSNGYSATAQLPLSNSGSPVSTGTPHMSSGGHEGMINSTAAPQMNGNGQEGVVNSVSGPKQPLLGKRRVSQENRAKQETRNFPMNQVNSVQSSVPPTQLNGLPMRASYTHSNPPPPLLQGNPLQRNFASNRAPNTQPLASLPSQPLPQEQQYYPTPQNYPAPQNYPTPQNYPAPQNTTGMLPNAQSVQGYHQQSFLPDWSDQVTVKKEFDGFSHPANQQYQQPANQGFQFAPHKLPTTHFIPQDHMIDLTNDVPMYAPSQPQCGTNSTQMQGPIPCMPQAPMMMGNLTPNGNRGHEQLPLLTREDLSVLDELDSYPRPNGQQYSQYSYS